MTNVGNINATLTLSQWEFNSGLKSSETAAIQFGNTAEVQANRVNASLSKIATGKSALPGVVQQAGYAFQDFSSQFATRGLAGGIGAVTNNIQAMGASLGPANAAMISIGAAVTGAVLPSVIDWLYNTKQLAEEVKAVEDRYTRLGQTARDIANIEQKGGADTKRKQLDEQAEVASKAREEIGKTLMVEMIALAKLKKERESQILFKVPIPFTNETMDVNTNSEKMQFTEAQITQKEAAVKKLEAENRALMQEAQQARELARRIAPGENKKVDAKDQEERILKQMDLENKVREQRDKASQEIDRKALADYGTESQRMQSKLAEERTRLDIMGVSKEYKARFEAQAAVQQSRAAIADAEKHLSELGTAAGPSAGVARDSAAGISAINRAVSGATSEQSMMKESINIQKLSLKVQEQTARNTSAGRGGDVKQMQDELMRESNAIQQRQLTLMEEARRASSMPVIVVSLRS